MSTTTNNFSRLVLAGAGIVLLAASVTHADGGAAHQTSLTRPIPLGVSGSSAVDRDGAFCCGGTLGALVRDCNGTQYILSNNHVLGRTNRASAGEDVVQPGLIDSSCRSSSAAVVADTTEFIPIDFDNANLVDSAIAAVRPGAVDPSGTVLDIGNVSSSVTEPALNMIVQKSSRTTGHTTGRVVALGVTVVVGYPKKCGGGSGPGAVMEDQFRISDGSFSAGGDSGAVIFESGSNPRAVGLLFAGSSTTTIANRISNVLAANWSVGPLAMAGGTPQNCSGGCASDGDCADSDPCTIDRCNAGSCSHTPVDCSDGDACTDDVCSGGTCSNPAIDCSDGDICTIDSCDTINGCANTVDPTCVNPCGDGVCDIASGEDCASCSQDCNGVTKGRPTGRYCCGSDVDCSDPRCTNGSGCVQGSVSGPGAGPHGARGLSIAEAKAVKSRHSKALLAIDGVVGHGIGLGADGEPVIEVYLGRRSASARAALPNMIEGISVRVEVTGPFVAF